MRTSSTTPWLRTRDLEALAFVGRGYEIAQYQLHEAIFAGRSPTVVSRFVVRAETQGLLVAERLAQIGMNRLRLTKRGRALLIDRGVADDELFAPAKTVALKDLLHTLAINDLSVAVRGLQRAPDFAWPAWYLQRRLGSAPAIPDLLVRWRGRTTHDDVLLACEIDLGHEGLSNTFVPKLERLRLLLRDTAEARRAGIVVFTRGSRRVERIEQYLGDRRIPVMPFVLPYTAGSREGIAAFRRVLDGAPITT